MANSGAVFFEMSDSDNSSFQRVLVLETWARARASETRADRAKQRAVVLNFASTALASKFKDALDEAKVLKWLAPHGVIVERIS